MTNSIKNDLSIDLPAGKYIVAVSGGVDSMVLLDVMRRNPDYDIIAAHFDHGIRPDSIEDHLLVDKYTTSHNIKYICQSGMLGENTSEDKARQARYNFLRHSMADFGAQAIITAHHQDDQIETAIINLLRGTGRRGLTSLASHDKLIRPLLGYSKAEIVEYAHTNHVPWREDSTNQDTSYLRNYVRHNIVAKFNEQIRQKWLQIIVRQSKLNKDIDQELSLWMEKNTDIQKNRISLPRYQLIMLPTVVSYEIFQYAIKQLTGNTVETRLADRGLLFAKTALSHKVMPIDNHWRVRAEKKLIIIESSSGLGVD